MPIGFSKNERPAQWRVHLLRRLRCYQLADEYSNYTPRNRIVNIGFLGFQHERHPTQGLWDGAERQVLR